MKKHIGKPSARYCFQDLKRGSLTSSAPFCWNCLELEEFAFIAGAIRGYSTAVQKYDSTSDTLDDRQELG